MAMNIFSITASALTAQSQRMNVTASNLANADSAAGPDGKPYRARQVVFQVDTASAQDIGGVKVSDVVESAAPARSVYDPKNPAANAEGYVTMSNVNPVEEMANMIDAARSYQANVEVANTAKAMMEKTLTLGQ